MKPGKAVELTRTFSETVLSAVFTVLSASSAVRYAVVCTSPYYVQVLYTGTYYIQVRYAGTVTGPGMIAAEC
jgi:hypothetical protein